MVGICGAELLNKGMSGRNLCFRFGETEAESAQLFAVAWSGVLHYPRRGLAMVGICGAELLKIC